MEFRILGPLEVLDGDQMLALTGAKPRALLAVLLLHANEAVSSTRLVDELWGEEPPATADKLVQGYVHALRKQLGAETLVTQPPGYRLRVEPHALDLLEFQRLTACARTAELAEAVELHRQALALWHGPPLADITFEGPSRHESGRLSELRLQTQIERIDAELELGRHAALIGELESLVAAHTYQERLHAQLILALYRSGRQAEALQAYQTVRRLLSDELGLQPGRALRELEAAILRQDASLDRGQIPTPSPAAPPANTPEAEEGENEQRPATVLVADIVGTNALANRLGSDEVNALLGECLAQMRLAVEEYGGAIHEDRADGICAIFGLAQVREHNPERAARTALRIQEVVGGYARDIATAWSIPDVAVRVGIDTGQADVGPREATEVAAGIASAARPGTIAVGDETVRRLAHRFTFERIGKVAVQTRCEPVGASRLVAPIAPSRHLAPRPLVGREHEVARLRSLISDLEAGRGQALLVVGEPGIGKSRLLAELRSLLPGEATWLEGQCLSYGGMPSWPFIEVFLHWLGVEIGDEKVVVRTRARARLAPLFGSDPARVLPGLGRLLRVELGADTGAAATPEEIRRSYVAWVEALTEQGPVVLAIDDLHWAHASSRELAEDLLALTERAPLLLVATLRRDPASEGWRFRTRVLDEFSHRAAELCLEPLAPTAAAGLLATLLPGAFDDATREQIVARAEGNPLYLEELLRALVEGGGLEQRHRTWTTTLTPARTLPPALENLLVARIDRLPAAPRRLAQIAAVIGREFAVAALERVAGEGTRADLARLLRAEIVREIRRYPELRCAFRHGLLQEAALSTLTPSARRELYGSVAAAFEELYASSLDDHLEHLAHYHARAGDVAAAIDRLERAAARASELGADTRAADLRERAATLARDS